MKRSLHCGDNCWTILLLLICIISRGWGWSRITRVHISVDNENEVLPAPLTSAILCISYDGSRFNGWSAANDPPAAAKSNMSALSQSVNGRRRRGSRIAPLLKGQVRSVEGVLRSHLAKLYGNLEPERIVVEGCSRTDKGVHARGMVAMIYGLNDPIHDTTGDDRNLKSNPINGKRLPHPRSPIDATYFLPVPQELPKLAFSLNRMLPPDIRIAGIAPTPNVDGVSKPAFHPSLCATSKTYWYRFEIAETTTKTDPTNRHFAWHVPTMRTPDMNRVAAFDVEKARQACRIIQGTHDFSSFQGAPSSETDRVKRLDDNFGLCTIYKIDVRELSAGRQGFSRDGVKTFIVEVTGDRFLYKMIRFLVGAVVQIGLGKGDLDKLDSYFDETTSNDKPFLCAPAHGLVLGEIEYQETIDWQTIRN